MNDSDLGTLAIDGERATITFRRRLPYPIDRVWAAIADPDQRRAWFGDMVIADGRVELAPTDPPVAPEAKRVTGRVLTWQPPAGTPRRAVFAHEWHQRIVEDGVVRYELSEDGAGTLLVFTHTGLSPRNGRGFIPGTHAFLDRLRAHLDGTDLPTWNARYRELAPAYG